MCSNLDSLELKEFSLPSEYPILKREENICKYAGKGWCPTCGRNTFHMRSQNECLEPCPKKTKDMNAVHVRNYLEHQEYENMDLDYDMKDGWFDSKQHKKMNPAFECCRLSGNEHQYYDCCNRVRSNLCELPTSYIRNTNCCQINQTLSTSKVSDCDKDYGECLESRVKLYEKSMRYVGYSEKTSVLHESHDKIKRKEIFDERIRKNCEKPEGILSLHRNAKCGHLEESEKPKCPLNNDHSRMQEYYNLAMKAKCLGGTVKQSSIMEQEKQCQSKICRCIRSLKSNNAYPSAEFDTDTYLDKYRIDFEAGNLTHLYGQEMENLRLKLRELKKSAYKNSTSAEMVAKSLDAKDKEMEKKVNVADVMAKQSPRGLRRTKSKLIRVKTRGSKMINTIKIRRSNTKITAPPRASVLESKYIQSDYSDSDESIKEAEDDSQTSDISPTWSTNKESNNSTDTGCGDFSLWPIRESLFPYVPPYIAFNSFNADEPKNVPIGRKFFKWKLSTITPVLVRKVVSNSGFVMVRKSNQWLGTWGKHIKSPMFKTLKDSQKLNHFPGTFQLGRKDRLWRNFQKMINSFGHKEFGFLPHTYVLPHELKQLKYNWENKNTGGEWWIIKPPASARGVGIKVINKWSQLPKKTSLVVQKYISNPYLINGSKFDLRLYVLVTSFNPLRVYLYSEGLVRFASVKYSHNPKDLKEKYMHLTNYSINKLSSNYTANEDANSAQGHKWTITKLLEYLSGQGVDTKVLWKSFEMLVVKTMIACESPITELCSEHINTRYNCYELFGIDVLLDSDLKPWLLEVNISPSLHSSSPLDEHVKGPMVQTLFNMVQFHFPIRLATLVKPNLKCYEPKLYTTHLTPKEVAKQDRYVSLGRRQDYLYTILENLTGDDIRHLIQAEDEFKVKGNFKRVFPTASTYKLMDFMEVRYYNRLFDAWEHKYEGNRDDGIHRLQALCSERLHFRGATLAGLQKSGQIMNPGVKVTSPKQKAVSKVVGHKKGMFSESRVAKNVVPSKH